MYTPRTLAAACLYDTLRQLDFHISSFKDWCRDVAKVDDADVDGIILLLCLRRLMLVEAVEDLRSLTRNGIGRDVR